MCEGSVSIAVDRDGVEGACDGREVPLIGLLMRPRSDRGRSCEQVNGLSGRSRRHTHSEAQDHPRLAFTCYEYSAVDTTRV